MLALLMALEGASAHNYLAETGDSTEIPDIAVSRAIYAELESPEAIHSYTFGAKAGQELFLQLTGPETGPSADFAPALALIAVDAALDPATIKLERGSLVDPEPWRTRLGADEADGLIVATALDSGFERFFEPVTGTRYRIRQTLSLKAPRDGDYRVAIFSPEGLTGKYIFAPGRLEKFSPAEIAGLGKVRSDVRAFMGEPADPGWILPAILVGIVVGTVALVMFILGAGR
jgi:hypothetical protein